MENHSSSNRLYRSRSDKMVAGVAGGLAQYFKVDPVLVRLAFVALAIVPGLNGIGILAYIVMAIVVPQRPLDEAEPVLEPSSIDLRRGRELGGMILVGIGALVLAGNLGMYHLFEWFNFRFFWPLVLIAIGVFLLLRRPSGRI